MPRAASGAAHLVEQRLPLTGRDRLGGRGGAARWSDGGRSPPPPGARQFAPACSTASSRRRSSAVSSVRRNPATRSAARFRPLVYGSRKVGSPVSTKPRSPVSWSEYDGAELGHPLELDRQLPLVRLGVSRSRITATAATPGTATAARMATKSSSSRRLSSIRSTVVVDFFAIFRDPGLDRASAGDPDDAGPSRPGRRRLQSPRSLRRRVRPRSRAPESAIGVRLGRERRPAGRAW